MICPHRSCASETDNFPPSFWDNLSTIFLTKRALRELDRRNSAISSQSIPRPDTVSGNLDQFAGNGGPDLGHLRGYPTLKPLHTASPPLGTQGLINQRTSIYDANFGHRLAELNMHGSLPAWLDLEPSQSPCNKKIIRQIIRPRGSTVPSWHTSGSAFQEFLFSSDKIVSLQKRPSLRTLAFRNIVSILTGATDIPNGIQCPFTNLAPVYEELAETHVPDFFDGSPLIALTSEMRDKLGSFIVPTKGETAPVLPNFFLEVDNPDTSASGVLAKMAYLGACGARAMHTVKNFGRTEPIYDNDAYAFTATYGGGILRIFSHHVTAPKVVGGQPHYHKYPIGSWDLIGHITTFRKGLIALENTRLLAKRHRDEFIQLMVRTSPLFRVDMSGIDEIGNKAKAEAEDSDDETDTDTDTDTSTDGGYVTSLED